MVLAGPDGCQDSPVLYSLCVYSLCLGSWSSWALCFSLGTLFIFPSSPTWSLIWQKSGGLIIIHVILVSHVSRVRPVPSESVRCVLERMCSMSRVPIITYSITDSWHRPWSPWTICTNQANCTVITCLKYYAWLMTCRKYLFIDLTTAEFCVLFPPLSTRGHSSALCEKTTNLYDRSGGNTEQKSQNTPVCPSLCDIQVMNWCLLSLLIVYWTYSKKHPAYEMSNIVFEF